MKLSLNKESAEILREFGRIMPVTIINIAESTLNVCLVYQSLCENLGVHRQSFYDMLMHIKEAQEISAEALKELPIMLERTAEKIEDYVKYNAKIQRQDFGYNNNFVPIDDLHDLDSKKIMRVIGKKWADTLSREEREAIRDYTKENPPFYKNINNVLRGKVKRFDDGNDRRGKLIHSALKSASTPFDMIVYRGGNNDILAQLSDASDEELEGKVFVDKGFVSTSMSAGSALSGDVLLVIHLPAGSCGVNIESLSTSGKYEEEILLDHGQLFYINSVNYNESGRRVVDVRVIN